MGDLEREVRGMLTVLLREDAKNGCGEKSRKTGIIMTHACNEQECCFSKTGEVFRMQIIC